MKTVRRFAAALTLSTLAATLAGCMSSGPQGGGASADEGFKISVPGMETDIKQGNTQAVTVTLQRGDYFKQNVALEIKSSPGLTVSPATILVKGSESPDVQIAVTAAKDASLGDYSVSVTGTPPIGQPTSADFKVKVVGQ
jgi:uncharacterized membrane protein